MKVTLNTPQKLIVEHKPWWPGLMAAGFVLVGVGVGWNMLSDGDLQGLMFGLTFVAMGLLAMWAFVRRAQIIFDRAANTIDIRRKSLTRHSRIVHKLEYLGGAHLESSHSGDTPTHRAAITLTGGMSEGTHPLTKAYYSGGSPQRAVDAINAWIALAE